MPEATTSKAERMGSGLGMYRAGGPTTIFGGSGWGPYSDGPLNAVKKSYLNREGVGEENWMAVAAGRTREADEEWGAMRRRGLGGGRGGGGGGGFWGRGGGRGRWGLTICGADRGCGL